jgi:type I restriction enzyme M protein
MIGEIFIKSKNEIQDPAKLYKLIEMINDEKWVILGVDVKGDIYEDCLRRMLKIQNQVRVNILLQERL